jgi:transposase-like protein
MISVIDDWCEGYYKGISVDRTPWTPLRPLQALNAERETPIRIRQKKYLNNVVEQDHRAIKRRTRPMLGFGGFSLCPHHSGRHRSHAYDRQGTDEVRSRHSAICRRAILRAV